MTPGPHRRLELLALPNRCTEAICLEASLYRSEQFAGWAQSKNAETPADETSGGGRLGKAGR